MQVTSAFAKAKLPDLLKAVAKGATVEITRYNKPVATLIPYKSSRSSGPKLGTAPPTVKIIDPNWAKPLTKKQQKDLLETGSY